MPRRRPQRGARADKLPGNLGEGGPFVFAEGTFAGSLEHPDHNEDATLILSDSRTVAVFDGLGGGERGEEASAIARELFVMLLQNLPRDLTEEEAIAVLDRIFREADRAIVFYASQVQAMGMGTAATAVVLVNGDAPDAWRAVVGSVADTRAYLFRDGCLQAITVDNVSGSTSEATIEEMARIQMAWATAEQADDLFDVYEEFFAFRSINQPLGEGTVDPRIVVVATQPGDRIILRTDGIHDNLTSGEIAVFLGGTDAEGAAAALIAGARERSVSKHFRAKPDDMSVVVIDRVREAAVSASPSAGGL